MYKAKLIAVVTDKKNKNVSTSWEVMEMRYRVKDNVLWITDHRLHTVDFDLDEVDVEIRTVSDRTDKSETIPEGHVQLLVNHYIGDDVAYSRQVKFVITEECLTDYLTAIEDDRTIKEFLDSYDSDESEAVYEYATDDNRISSEEICYCDDFNMEYDCFFKRMKEFNPSIKSEEIATKEAYYWHVYAAKSQENQKVAIMDLRDNAAWNYDWILVTRSHVCSESTQEMAYSDEKGEYVLFDGTEEEAYAFYYVYCGMNGLRLIGYDTMVENDLLARSV